jgi:chemotaxis protein methyltransferase CheR
VYASLEETLRRRAGLVFRSLRRESVEAAATRVMRRVGIGTPEMFVPMVQQDGAVFDDLMAEVTIGETYFFRESAHFALLRERIIPEFRARQEGDQKLRVWSAGSSTGEEPYSIAIALQEQRLGGHVVGTDISRARLAAARRAQYRRWSFRGVPESMIDRYFRRESDDTFVLVPSVRREVEFRYLNLAADSYPSMSSGVWGMDVIFCRNVLIYFDRDTIAHVAESLVASLAEDGWILLGATDPPLSDFVKCEVVQTPAGLAYRHFKSTRLRSTRGALAPATIQEIEGEVVVLNVAPDVDIPVLEETPEPPQSPVASSGIASALQEKPGAPSMHAGTRAAAEVRDLANAGRLEEAGRVCAAALDRFRSHPELHYLHAVLLAHAGQFAESARAAKRALYLDRSMIVAHLTLGNALMRGGQSAAARRALANAAQLLERMPAGDIVPFSDGEPAARLLEMTRMQARLLRGDVV